MAEQMTWPALIGMVGGLVGLAGGVASFYDRFYKGRPVASLTTRNSSGRTIVLIRIKNTTSYDVVVTGSKERKNVYFVAEDSTTLNIIKGQMDRSAPTFILKPDETRELLIMPKFKDNMPVDVLKPGYIAFWISWRRGNATWLPQIPVPVCTTTQTIRKLGGVE
ncbi:hypothetical protein ABID59_006282 [Bradyrhizobium sp. S3.3.6]|uniref:hypothetical protein n=1 Tax=Bradyrhizobium sp. S3.3.6 TaxID=3156429 RepID=UPI003393AB10